MPRGKYAVRSENAQIVRLQSEVDNLNQRIDELKRERDRALTEAARGAAHKLECERLEAQLALGDPGGLLKDEVKRLQGWYDEMTEEHTKVIKDAWKVVEAFRRRLDWGTPECDEFVAQHSDGALHPSAEDGSFTSRAGIQKRAVPDEGMRRIQRARGARKATL